MLSERFDRLENEVFSWENVSAYLPPWHDLMEEPLKKSSRRFTGSEDYADLDKRSEEIRLFCKNRGPEVRRQFNETVNESQR